MRKILGVVAAAAMAFSAGVAFADEASGKIEHIDAMTKMVTVGGKTFQVSENSSGVKLDELKEGDQVKIMYEPNQDGHNDVMEISKE